MVRTQLQPLPAEGAQSAAIPHATIVGDVRAPAKPTIPLHVHPTRRLWSLLQDLPSQLGDVQVWRARHAEPPAGVETHMHTVPTLVACLAGVVRVTGGPRAARQAIDLPAGHALVIMPGVWHRHEPLRPGCATFSQGFVAHASDLLLADHETRLWSQVPLEPCRAMMGAVVDAETATARREALAALVRQVVIEPAEPLARLHPALARMVSTMWHRLHQPIGAKDVIAASGLGRSQAFALFQQYFGESPKRSLSRQRLELARALLAEGFPVTEVAARCGFPSRANFTRLARRELGVPPSRLRDG